MSFLAPIFLLGALAIALPVWLHRLQIQSSEREKFSSAMLLESSTQRIHTRRKLRYLLLLALRILLIALLALLFAKPVIEQSFERVVESGGVLHLLVIDTSFSMQHGDRFDEAIDEAVDLVDSLPPADAAWVISAGAVIDLVAGPTTDTVDVPGALRSLSPSDGRLDLGVLVENINTVTAGISDDVTEVAIHLFSDFQASSVPARFSDLLPDPVYGKNIDLRFHPVGRDDEANWVIEFVHADPAGVDVGVRGIHTDAGDQDVRLQINGAEVGVQSLSLAASGRGVVRFDGTEYELGDNRVEAALDDLAGFAGDDRYFAVYDNSPPVPVLLLTADSGSRSALYLRTAIESDQAGYVAEVVDVSLFDPRVLPRYPWIVIDDLGILDDQAASAIRQYVESGGALLAGMGAALTADDVIPVTGNGIGTGDVNRRPVYRVSQIDVSHPVLVETKGWQSITVRQMLPVAPGDGERVLISLDDGRPLLLEGAIGQGRYLLFTSSLDNQWNDLPIHPVFVSFIVEAARFLSTSDMAERQLTIGGVITLRQAGVSSGQVMDPDGQRVLALADTLHAQSITVIKKGYYDIYTNSSDLLVAVNVDGRESDLSAMTEEQLAAWRTAAEDTDRGSSATGAETAVAELEETPPLEVWRWVLLLLLVVVIVESALGNRHLTRELEAA